VRVMQALHFIQIIHSGRFQLFDYGSPSANIARYGTPRPPDIGSQVSSFCCLWSSW